MSQPVYSTNLTLDEVRMIECALEWNVSNRVRAWNYVIGSAKKHGASTRTMQALRELRELSLDENKRLHSRVKSARHRLKVAAAEEAEASCQT